MLIGLGQINAGGDVQANLQKVEHYTTQAAEAGVSFIVFPEATMSAFGTPLKEACLEHGEEWRRSLQSLASNTGTGVIVGEFEVVNDRVKNLAAVYFHDGSRKTYAKIHTYDAFGYRESDSVEPGDAPVIVTIDGAEVGLAICYDIRFPKLFAELSRAGANIIAVPTSWGAGPGKVEQWQILARARALDSNTTIVAVDQADPAIAGVAAKIGVPTGVGHSVAVDPFGRTITELAGGEELAIIDVDMSQQENAQKNLPILTNAKLGY